MPTLPYFFVKITVTLKKIIFSNRIMCTITFSLLLKFISNYYYMIDNCITISIFVISNMNMLVNNA